MITLALLALTIDTDLVDVVVVAMLPKSTEDGFRVSLRVRAHGLMPIAEVAALVTARFAGGFLRG
jgi:hypothetical protein